LKKLLKKKVETGIFVRFCYAPRFGTWCNIAVGVTVEVIPHLFPGCVIGIIVMEKRM